MKNILRRWAWPAALRSKGILGINARNALYVLPQNRRQFFPRVDNKLQTKQICEQRGIPVPATYGVVARYGDVRRFEELLAGRDDFVIKPAGGSEGRGIVVVVGRDSEGYHTAGGHRATSADLRYHLSTVLSGLYSLGGQPDAAILEQRIVKHPVFERVAVGGTPDVRIILYRGVPVMAMVRLPTHESRGRANLHQGAIAAGVDLATGRTFGGVCHNRAVDRHPDTGAEVAGIEVPCWPALLDAAVRLAEAVELAYLGVDFVLDVHRGPVILEANARPGLAIQVANRRGLAPRLELVDRQAHLLPAGRAELIAMLAQTP